MGFTYRPRLQVRRKKKVRLEIEAVQNNLNLQSFFSVIHFIHHMLQNASCAHLLFYIIHCHFRQNNKCLMHSDGQNWSGPHIITLFWGCIVHGSLFIYSSLYFQIVPYFSVFVNLHTLCKKQLYTIIEGHWVSRLLLFYSSPTACLKMIP